MCNTAAKACVAEWENPATIIADIAFVAVIGRQAPRRRCTGQDVRAGDSLAYRQARMLGLDGVDSGNATSPTAVPPHDFRINLHHSSQRRGSRAHTYTGPTLGLLHAQAMEPETYHVGDMLGRHGARDGPGRGMAGGEGREQPRAGSAGCHRLRRRRAVRVPAYSNPAQLGQVNLDKESGCGRESCKRVPGRRQRRNRVQVVLVVVILGVQESQDLRKVRLRPEVANGPQTCLPNTGRGLEASEQTRH